MSGKLMFLPMLLLIQAMGAADVVHLRNGGRLEGSVLEEGDRVVLRLESGTVKIPRQDVLRIDRRPAPYEEYQSRAAKAGQNARNHWDLALWCEQAGLPRSARVELEAVISLEPDHAEARRKLGYEKIDGSWLRGEALLTAKGMVKVDGRWVTSFQAAAIAEEKKKREEARRAAEQLAFEAKKAREEALGRARYEPTGTFRTIWTYPRVRSGYRYGVYGYSRYGFYCGRHGYRRGYGGGYPGHGYSPGGHRPYHGRGGVVPGHGPGVGGHAGMGH